MTGFQLPASCCLNYRKARPYPGLLWAPGFTKGAWGGLGRGGGGLSIGTIFLEPIGEVPRVLGCWGPGGFGVHLQIGSQSLFLHSTV